MNYAHSLHYLNSFLNLERIQLQSPRIWNLGRMRLLLEWAGHPEKHFFPILIAGTKGKGSTGFFLESILRRSRIPVGFYSSPHLEDPRERIRIHGEMISKGLWCKEVLKVKRMLKEKSEARISKHETNSNFQKKQKANVSKSNLFNLGFVSDFGFRNSDLINSVTYFEIMTLMAMRAFRDQKVRVGIFEVGMGGRLDATNVLTSPLVILTPIHLDHEAILGPTIGRIAHEKAAVIKRKAHVVVAPQPREAMREIERRIRKQKAYGYEIASSASGLLAMTVVGLVGDYQHINAAAARKAAELLQDRFGFPILQKAISQGLQAKNWPGRMESIRSGKAEFLLDGAHNPISIQALVRNLKRLYPHRKRLLVFGTSRDKKSVPMLQTLSRYFPEIVITCAPSPRSMEIENLLLQARGLFRKIYPAGTVQEALRLARRQIPFGGLIVVSGSFYLIGEARKLVYA